MSMKSPDPICFDGGNSFFSQKLKLSIYSYADDI